MQESLLTGIKGQIKCTAKEDTVIAIKVTKINIIITMNPSKSIRIMNALLNMMQRTKREKDIWRYQWLILWRKINKI